MPFRLTTAGRHGGVRGFWLRTPRAVTFVSDSFTDVSNTLLSAHTAEIGGTWVKHPNTTNFGAANVQRIDGSNRVWGNHTSGTSVYLAGATPSQANYDVETAIVIVTKLSDAPGVAARIVNSSASQDMYLARLAVGTSVVELYEVTGGVTTMVASQAVTTVNVGETHTLRLECRDALKRVLWDGVSVATSTNNAVTAAGFPGLRFAATTGESATAGSHYESFLAQYP